MTIKIQGTIVGPDYDDAYFQSWIERGIITPSSRVVAAIESATEPIDVYINSYGGDVFAGGEMMIALAKCNTRKCLASVEVGSIAASMAANIVANLAASGVKVTAHANSQLMFHGCYTSTEGGAQHHEDVAASLRNINESVIADLNRIGVTECRAWFNEGREKWMSADEGVELGLFSSIVEADAEAPVEMKRTAARLAAFASSLKSRKEYAMDIDSSISAEGSTAETAETPSVETPETAAAPVEQAATEAVNDEASHEAETQATEAVADVEARANELANERFAKLQSAHDKMISDLTKERDAALKDLENAKALSSSLAADIEKLNIDHAKELDALRAQLTKAESDRESVVARALAPAPKTRKLSAWGESYRTAVKR